jgi:hypothetical protein
VIFICGKIITNTVVTQAQSGRTGFNLAFPLYTILPFRTTDVAQAAIVPIGVQIYLPRWPPAICETIILYAICLSIDTAAAGMRTFTTITRIVYQTDADSIAVRPSTSAPALSMITFLILTTLLPADTAIVDIFRDARPVA